MCGPMAVGVGHACPEGCGQAQLCIGGEGPKSFADVKASCIDRDVQHQQVRKYR